MKSKSLKILATLLIVGWCVVSVEYILREPDLEISRTTLSVDPDQPIDEFSESVLLTNRGRAPLKVWAIKKTCSCVNASLGSKIIQPGDVTELSISLDKFPVHSASLLLATNDPDLSTVKIWIEPDEG